MTQISAEEIQHLATLSMIQLAPSEVEAMQTDIEHILEYVQQLDDLDTTGVEPTYQVTDLQNVWRADEIDTYGVGREALLALAPEQAHNQIKVPKVL